MSFAGGNNGPNSYSETDPRFYTFLNEPYKEDATETTDYKNVVAAIKFLRSKPTTPFMVFLPLTKPHPPYSCPEPFYSSINASELPPLRPPGSSDKPDFHALIREYRNLTALNTLEGGEELFFRQLHAVYLGSISFSDFLFGMLMAALKDSGLEDSTTVTVFADHGDYAGDYGLVEKWPSGLEDVLTRVPLLVRTPGGTRGHVVQEPVQLFDIVPTTLELANITAQHVHFGKSLVQQLQGAMGDPTRAVYAEGGYSTHEPRDFEGDASTGGIPRPKSVYYPKLLQQQEKPLSVCRASSVRTLTHKLIFRTDPLDADHHSELYDLAQDPQELRNVYGLPEYAQVQADLKNKLFLWFMQTSDVTPWVEDPRSGLPDIPKADTPVIHNTPTSPARNLPSGFPFDATADTSEERHQDVLFFVN
ncbi:hypothetical protein CYMTET_25817 [Cymbomonas tetramitiformis]|uniref:Sulfatase n=1 Tax=Cymbomonas tetramitiformis TaxID=36881 RepID=A0AAE0KYN6_9CHLO|nr:hypothetical protein CYMTET_25817 [Cymbomonas tetramitiformis]